MDGIELTSKQVLLLGGVVVGWCVIQAFLYYRLSMKFSKKHHLLSKEDIKSCWQLTAMSTIGPSLNSIVVSLSLVALLGPTATWFRLSVLGGPHMEFMCAQNSAMLMDLKIGVDTLSATDFTYILYAMCIFGIPYFITTVVLLPPLDKSVTKQAKKASASPLNAIISAAGIGTLAYACVRYLTGPAQIAALASAMIVSSVVTRIAKTKNIKWLHSLNILFCILAGMFFGQLTQILLG